MFASTPSFLVILVLSSLPMPANTFERIYLGETRDYCLHESFNASCRQPANQLDSPTGQHAHFSSSNHNNIIKNPSNNVFNPSKKATTTNTLSTLNINQGMAVKRVVLLNNAVYGRMRLGRCIGGDFNKGCSMSVTYYVDSQCSGRESCGMSVRNLVDIHPCQRDFMSYLEASYSCVDVHATRDSDKCYSPNTLTLKATPSGRILHESIVTPLTHSLLSEGQLAGSENCPWRIVAMPGQRIRLKILVIGDENILPGNKEDFVRCSDVIVVKETTPRNGRIQLDACDGMSRERVLHTSNSSDISLHVINLRDGSSLEDLSDDVAASDQSKESSQDGEGVGEGRRKKSTLKFILSYEAQGCQDLSVPYGVWIRKSPENVMVRCNHSLVTWYLTCQGNRWVGVVGNCTGPVSKSFQPDSELWFSGGPMFPTLGILLAVLLGIGLGIIIGMVLLLFVHCLRKKAVCNGTKQGYPGLVRRKGDLTDPNYHHHFPHEPPHMYGCVSLIDQSNNNEPYHPLRSSSLPPETAGNVVFPPAPSVSVSKDDESGKLLKTPAFKHSTTPLSMQHYNSAADNRSMRKYNSQPRSHHHNHLQPQQHYSMLQYDECCPTCIAHDLNNEQNVSRMSSLIPQQTQQKQQNSNLNESILYPIALRNPEGHYTINKTNNNNNYSDNLQNNNQFRDDKICVV